MLGIHISLSRFEKDIAELHKHGGSIIQIFLSPPQRLTIIDKSDEYYTNMKNILQKYKMSVVVHATYMANIADNWDRYSIVAKNLEHDIIGAYKIGAIGLVIHLGKHLGKSIETSYRNMFSTLLGIHKKTEKYSSVKIILETPSGQGTELCYQLEDFAIFYNSIIHNTELANRVKICVDTCHIFAAGHDIKHKFSDWADHFDKLIGLKNIAVIHLNDSKGELGCRVDRHAVIGYGKIGKKSLINICNFFIMLNIPVVIETPADDFVKELKMLL